MSNTFLLYAFGILFCASGIYLFFRKIFEEGQSIFWPVIVIIMGIILIAVAAATSVGLLPEK